MQPSLPFEPREPGHHLKHANPGSAVNRVDLVNRVNSGNRVGPVHRVPS